MRPDAGTPLAPGQAPPVQPPEQARYADWLVWGTRAGLVVVLAGYVCYVSGLVQPLVPLDRLPSLWSLPLHDYLHRTGTPTGWAWWRHIGHSDMLSLSGIALLAGCSVLSLLSLVPLYAARRDRAYVSICLADAAVVLLAASGWLTGGH